LTDYFTAGSSDSSIATRQADWEMVETLVTQNPWFGTGGGSYVPTNAIDILDNQYLETVVELGLVGGLVVVVLYLFFPMILAFKARARSRLEGSRELGAALGAAVSVALVGAATFDAFSFAMFAYLYALLVGLIGAYWRLIRAEERDRSFDTVGSGRKPLEAS
jgi:O-antigen ligase